MATKYIGRGVSDSSTFYYALNFGHEANSHEYDPDDVVFVSVNGQRSPRLAPDLTELGLAVNAEAIIVTDCFKFRAVGYNVGEREVEDYLIMKGYVEVGDTGTWLSQTSIPSYLSKYQEAKLYNDVVQNFLRKELITVAPNEK